MPTSNFVPECTESWDDESKPRSVVSINFVCVCCINMLPLFFLFAALIDYVVEIAPRTGLFSSNAHGVQREEKRRPQVRSRAQVSNPPELRMPRGTQGGTGSEVHSDGDDDDDACCV